MRDIEWPGGGRTPAIGQGTWHMGERGARRAEEVAALRQGLELGLTLIDTAEMYAEGGAETVVGEAIAGRREEVFLVSKVYPHNASRNGVVAACERSLARLGTDHLDLYLLHWRGRYPLQETLEGFERLLGAGKIRRWGVSNFDVADMQELFAAGGSACAANQVLYHPGVRGIEYDLLPWCQARGVPLMAYSPLGQGGALLHEPALHEVAQRHGVSAAQVALAWALRQHGVMAIPKAVDAAHLRSNAQALALQLSDADLALIDDALPPPRRATPLQMA